MLSSERKWKLQEGGSGTGRSNKRIAFVYEELVFVLSKCKLSHLPSVSHVLPHTYFKYDWQWQLHHVSWEQTDELPSSFQESDWDVSPYLFLKTAAAKRKPTLAEMGFSLSWVFLWCCCIVSKSSEAVVWGTCGFLAARKPFVVTAASFSFPEAFCGCFELLELGFCTESLRPGSWADGSVLSIISGSSDPKRGTKLSETNMPVFKLGIDHLSHFSVSNSFSPGKTRGLCCPLQTWQAHREMGALTTSWLQNKKWQRWTSCSLPHAIPWKPIFQSAFRFLLFF